jgi:hypothetical protein
VTAEVIGCLILARAIANLPIAELPDRPLKAREMSLAPQREPGA